MTSKRQRLLRRANHLETQMIYNLEEVGYEAMKVQIRRMKIQPKQDCFDSSSHQV